MKMKMKIAVVVGAVVFAGAAAANPVVVTAESMPTRTPLVELYTSEGCSSCPPADNFLRDLGAARTADFHLLPLAFHVDYWNYLGWHDPFSQPKFTARQREIAVNNRQRNIYTPELVADGREARAGGGIARAIMRANKQPAAAQIKLIASRESDTILAAAEVANESTARAAAHFVIYERDITREIGGGENRGRTLQHDFVVRYFSAPKNITSGGDSLTAKIEIPHEWNKNKLGLAVVVLQRDTGATVQTAQTPLTKLFSG